MHSIEELPEVIPPTTHLTPRSHEALKRSGYRLSDLSKKTLQEISEIYNDNETSRHIIDKRVEHEESKRKSRLQAVAELRKEVLEEEKKGIWSVRYFFEYLVTETKVPCTEV